MGQKEFEKNNQIVKKFLDRNNLPAETIIGLEIEGQISDGEFEYCNGNYTMDFWTCFEELEKKYPKWNFYSKEQEEEWRKVRKGFDFCPERNTGIREFDPARLDISKGFCSSLLMDKIREDVLGIIYKNLS